MISSVSYGIATAGRVLPVGRGERVLVLQDDHSSPVLEWLGAGEAARLRVETVARPEDGDWTRAVLAAIARPGAASWRWRRFRRCTGRMAAWSTWSAWRLRGGRCGAGGVDATHDAGILPIDVRRLDPDFLVFPTYKWVLGPYGRAFLTWRSAGRTACRWSRPDGRREPMRERALYARLALRYDARRFDMGERDLFITLEMAAIGMELVADWGTEAITERLSMLTGRLAEGLPMPRVSPFSHPARAACAEPEVSGRHATRAAGRLAAENVFVSPRLGRLRISPHVYNDEVDVDRFLATFRKVTG